MPEEITFNEGYLIKMPLKSFIEFGEERGNATYAEYEEYKNRIISTFALWYAPMYY